MNWIQLNIPAVYIKTREPDRIKVILPYTAGKYAGWIAWIPDKLIRISDNKTTIAMKPGYDMTIQKLGRDERNWIIITDEQHITGADFIKWFALLR